MRITLGLALLAGAALVTAAVLNMANEPEQTSQQKKVMIPEGSQSIVVGGGCFWCVEPLFEMLKGVSHVEVGYAGGKTSTAAYSQVLTGRTDHAEVTKVFFDPKVISADDILRIFFTIHDPTTLNRQGADVGTQYRSVVFFTNDEEKARAEKIIKEIEAEKIWDNPIVTTLEPLDVYVTAEESHQDYYRKFETATPAQRAKMNGGYCSAVITPKVSKFRKKFDHLLKK